MSFEVPIAHVQAYGANVEHLSQQNGSRLRNTVTVSTGLPGTRYNFEQIGAVTAVKRTARHGDSPLISTPHSRRILDLEDYEWGDLVDNEDMLRTLYDPTNPYTEAAIKAMGRAIDTAIIEAAIATSVIGVTDGLSTTTEAFDVTNQAFGYGAPGTFAVADLITARGKLRAAEAITDGEMITCVCSSAIIDDLLADSDVKTIDSNTVRALTNGEVASFMGFTFIQTQLVANLGVDGTSGDGQVDGELAYFYPRSAIRLGIGADITAEVQRRPDKSYAWYPYVRMSIGATRTENVKIVVANQGT